MPRAATTPGDPEGRPIEVAPGVLRLTAGNPGPFTFRGTNSYIVGRTALAVIDPGPDDPAHRAALLAAVGGRRVAAILLTHRHRDHAAGAAALAAAVGAPLLAGEAGAQHPARKAPPAGAPPLAEPDRLLADGAALEGGDWRLLAVATPGHASDHLCFALAGEGALFSGDHVMGWSTTSVAPPDGSMAAYVASLDKLGGRPERLYLPGHGDPIANGPHRVALLRAHRRRRERAILSRLRGGDRSVAAIAAAVYPGLDAALLPAARAAVLAHLIDLAARRLVRAEPEFGPDAAFFPDGG